MKKDKYSLLKDKLIITVVLIILVLLFYLLNPNFLNSYNLLSMGQSLAPYLVMAIGVTFVVATGGIDLSIGTTCIAAAVIAGKLYTSSYIPLWATIPIMIFIGTLVGLCNGLLITKLHLPPFIATLGMMMAIRGLSAILVVSSNVFYPSNTWFNNTFSTSNGIPTGVIWCAGLTAVGIILMNKTAIGRYSLAIGSNEEATKLSGIDTDKYKLIAYVIGGLCAGMSAIFWAASFPTVTPATGNGMELDAIAGVYIGGTSSAGGVASVFGTAIGSILLVVIRSGMNFVLAKFNIEVNATYLTYLLTGIIVICSVMFDVMKNERKKYSRTKKKSNTKIIISVTAIILVIFVVAGSFIFIGKEKEEKTIAVIAKGETHAFWLNVKAGGEAAAKKYGYKITFRGPASESAKDLPAQMEMARTALSNGCSALVLATNGEGFTDILMQAYDTGVPVVEFDSGVFEADKTAVTQAGKNPIISSVALDSYSAGALAAENFFESIKDKIAASDSVYGVGVILHDTAVDAVKRETGFVDKFSELADADIKTVGKYEIYIEEKQPSNDNPYKIALESLYEKGVSAIYMTNEGVVKEVKDAIDTSDGKYNEILFCGFDAGSKQLEWMTSGEKPLLFGSVAQDSYSIGYYAVEQAIFAIENADITEKVSVNGVWWNSENAEELNKKGIVYEG